MNTIIPQFTPVKRCTGCKHFWPATDAYFNKRIGDTLQTRCKKCTSKGGTFGFPSIKYTYDPQYAQSTDLFTAVKRCTKCKRWQHATLDIFSKDNKRKDSLNPYCKQCRHVPPKPSDVPEGHKRCPTCKNVHPWNEEFFHRTKRSTTGFDNQCKTCKNARGREYSMRPDVRSERLVRQTGYNNTHKETHAVQMKIWYEAHRESEQERQRYRYIKHREEIRVASHNHYLSKREAIRRKHRAYYTANKEAARERNRNYYLLHKDEKREYSRQYMRTERGKANNRKAIRKYLQTERGRRKACETANNRHAHKKGVPGTHTAQEVLDQYRRQKGRCYYCKVRLGKGKRAYHADHTFPLSREHARNSIDHLVVTCPTCNLKKGDRYPWEFSEGGRLL